MFWIIGIIIFIILFITIDTVTLKDCPFCKEKIDKKATACKHCHKDLPKEAN